MHIQPFRALRPREDLAESLAAVPYDVVDAEEAAALAAGNPHSFLHVSRSEIDLPAGTDPYSPAVYAKAAESFRRFQAAGWLLREDQPRLYLYRQTVGGHAQRGVVACLSVAEYEDGIIRKHEKTRRDKEDDRVRHIEAIGAQSGPVFLAYRDRPEINALAAAIEAERPLYDFLAADGVRHTVWRTAEETALVDAFGRVSAAYIADGHHRAASAALVAARRRAADPASTGREAYNSFLGVLFSARQLRILPYNRCVKDLRGLSPAAFLERVRGTFEVKAAAVPCPPAPGSAAMFLGGVWYGLRWTVGAELDAVGALDVSVLQNRLLAPILGIDDPRTNPRIDFVGGSRGTEELERRVREGRAAAAFSLHPVRMEQIMDVSDAGQVMPPKSTWFEPKLRSGLLVHEI